MAKGKGTFMGLAVPLSGEAEMIATTAANDVLTLTGAASHTGAYLTGVTSGGVEDFAIAGLSSSDVAAGLKISVTSTGAMAAGATLANGVLIAPSSKAIMQAAFAYQNDATAVGTTNYLLACHGSKSPTFLLGVGATAVGIATATSNGFVVAGLFLTAALATTTPMVGLKVKFGDSEFYVMCVAHCGMSA